MANNFKKHMCTPNQIQWLDENNITSCDQLYDITMSALRKWRASEQGSQARINAWKTYNICKKIFPKVNMQYYWNNVH